MKKKNSKAAGKGQKKYRCNQEVIKLFAYIFDAILWHRKLNERWIFYIQHYFFRIILIMQLQSRLSVFLFSLEYCNFYQ